MEAADVTQLSSIANSNKTIKQLPPEFLSLGRLCPTLRDVINTLRPIGSLIRERWKIHGLIGSGGYGEIYYAVDLNTKESVAIKVEPVKRKGRTARRMILEQKVLLRLQGSAHVPLLWGSGSEYDCNYIVMQLLSVNVNDLRKQSPLKRFSRATAGRIMQQAIAGLREMHRIGYLHRDVKLANMCFGLSENSKHRLVVVDFGLVRRYRSLRGHRLPLRSHAGFRGTLRYVSIRVHDRQEQGPADDLVALFFGLIEMASGELSWKYADDDNIVKAAKLDLITDDFAKVSENFGEDMREFGRIIMSVAAEEDLDYNILQRLMKDLAGGRPLRDPYDWEDDYNELLAEAHCLEKYKKHLLL